MEADLAHTRREAEHAGEEREAAEARSRELQGAFPEVTLTLSLTLSLTLIQGSFKEEITELRSFIKRLARTKALTLTLIQVVGHALVEQ